MANRASKPATYDDILKLPDHVVGEILEGELFVSPRPAPPHAHATSVIGADVLGPFHRTPGGPGGPGGWWILDEPELHLRSDVLVPDLAGWRRERMPTLPTTAAFELAPDWACEVTSPSTVRIDRSRKMRIYRREKVAHLWLVDPLARLLEVFRLEDSRWFQVEAYGEDTPEKVRVEPFDAIELELSRWWVPEPATPESR
ncbi:MAG: Uma2 family endonuclease [Deltaproteobacteria bacterium]|nr:Uma2 family endonuclease [Deltaproteobacteria bacterium]